MGNYRSLSLYLLGFILAGYLTSNLFQVVKKNYYLKLKLETMEEESALLKAQNDYLKYQIAYFKTPEYQDKAARAKLGLQLPGETVVLLPQPKTAGPNAQQPVATAKSRSNFQQWLDFLGGRPRL